MDQTTNPGVNQWYIRIAVIVAVIASLGFTWLVMVAGALKPNIVNMLTQALVVAIIATLFWLVIRRFRRTRQELQTTRDNAEKEAALLRQRSAFIYEASDKLAKKLATFEQETAGLDPNDPNAGPLLKKTAELHDMLHRLETISKLEANMALTSKTTVDAAALLDQAAVKYQAKFDQMGAKLEVTGVDSVMVDADAEMLTEVFVAIIDNAAKFVPSQSGLLDITHSVRHGKWYVTFTDNGPGIPVDKMAELFQPFSRIDGVMAFNRQGQGLSLYISRLCVEIMGGHIDLSSQQGKGTTVTIELQLAKKSHKRPH